MCGTTLLEVDLNSVDELTDHIVPVIAEHCQSIQGADFGFTQLTNDAIRWLSTKLPFATKDEENGTVSASRLLCVVSACGKAPSEHARIRAHPHTCIPTVPSVA